MSKKKWIILITFVVIIFITVISLFLLKKKENKKPNQNEGSNTPEVEETKQNVTITGVSKENCTDLKELYTEQGNIRFYTSCLDEIIYEDETGKSTLQEAMIKNKVTIDVLISKLKEQKVVTKISSVIYSGESEEIKNLSILKCNTNDGNVDYYFGDKDLEYQEGFCERTCTFTKTYYILSAKASEDTEYYLLTLMKPGGTDIASVKVKKELNQKYTMNAAYEFTFTKEELDMIQNDNISDLFDAFPVVSVEKSNKQREEQTQEAICKIK